MSSSRCLAVMYHYVRDRADTPESDIRGLDVAKFQSQLDTLCDTLTPVDWPTLVAWRAGRSALPENAFLLTFDDGLADHTEVVFPILEARGLRGVFFVQTGVLVDRVLDPVHQIHLLLAGLGLHRFGEALRVKLDALGPDSRDQSLPDPIEARRMYPYETPPRAELKHMLTCTLPTDLRRRLIDELFAEHVGDSRAVADRWYLQWDHLAAMQRVGHTIGGHGHRHELYSRFSVSEQAADMARCAAILREGLGSDPRPFSYPYGCCDEQIERRCAFAGFVNGFTTRQGWIEAFDDAHSLCRVDTIHVDAFLEREFACIPH